MGAHRIVPAHEEHSKYTQEVGEALHQWSMVEVEIATLFEVVSGMPNQNAAQAAMAAIVSFEARLQVCNAVLSFFDLSELHRSYWTRTFNRLAKKAKKRNELAHFSIVAFELEGGEMMWRLMPYFSFGQVALSHHKTGEVGQGLSLDQVRERGISFHLLGKDVAWFTAEMLVLLGKLKANRRLTPDLVRQLQKEAAQAP